MMNLNRKEISDFEQLLINRIGESHSHLTYQDISGISKVVIDAVVYVRDEVKKHYEVKSDGR